jgi:hypothetical protein
LAKAPAFPYPRDHWLGQPSSSPRNHSGCLGGSDQQHVRTWQQQMRSRGWKLAADGCYGPESEATCRQFQSEKGLEVDGDVGPKTWRAAWSAETTRPPKPPSPSGWRSRSSSWHNDHLGITESPAGSNCDRRQDGIRAAQDGCANGTWLRHQPWCGVWCWAGLHAAGKVKQGDSWLASVAQIEDRARKGLAPFRGWTSDGSRAKTGDLVVLFGRGVHVGTVRSVDANYVYTWEGNTSSGNGGSQSNGGGSYKRARSRRTETYGYCLIGD